MFGKAIMQTGVRRSLLASKILVILVCRLAAQFWHHGTIQRAQEQEADEQRAHDGQTNVLGHQL